MGGTITTIMKIIKQITAAALAATFLVAPFAGLAADAKADAKAKPYPLKTCVVSGEKLGEMGSPCFHHEVEGQLAESCQKDFKKDPAKFIKKIEEAEAKDKKS
jgi:hypothetical protein